MGLRTLVIDSATEACSAALFEEGELISGRFEMLGRGHAERLVPMIAELPDKGRAAKVVVALGPGSFTGIRVGLATARALALAWKAELAGYETLSLIAAQAHAGEDLSVCTTGGHGEWFVQRFAPDAMPLAPPASMPPRDAAEFLTDARVAGSQAEALVAQRGHGTAFPAWPDARQFGRLAPSLLTHDVRPAYGRAPDAKLPLRAV